MGYHYYSDGGVTLLAGGNYVVRSREWDNGAIVNAGAVTWGSANGGVVGPISATNSLVGTSQGASAGGGGVLALNNGNYLVLSPNARAVTWGSGTSGVAGAISAANSLIGSSAYLLGGGVIEVGGGYVVRNPDWSGGGLAGAGAVTWGSAATGITGAVSAANSLIGSSPSDHVGSGAVQALPGAAYVVLSPAWNHGGSANAGAVTCSTGPLAGPITAENSVRGVAAGGGSSIVYAYDEAVGRLVVGQPADSLVTIWACCDRGPATLFLPIARRQ